MNIQYPLAFKKALVRGYTLTKDETLFQTVYSNKCLSFRNLYTKLPAIEFEEELKSKTKLKDYLALKIKEGGLVKDRAPDFPQYKKSGYAVDLKTAYKNKYPYTLMSLDPLPALERDDYIYHLFLNTDPYVPDKIFPEEKHEMLDNYFSNTIFYSEQLFQDLPAELLSMNENLKISALLDAKVVSQLKERINESKEFLKSENRERWDMLKKAEYFIHSHSNLGIENKNANI